MAFSQSLLLLRRLHHYRIPKPNFFSSLSSIEPNPNPNPNSDPPEQQPPPKPTSLSARMNFIFDQIDAIEQQRSEQDDTLQRIRKWRLSKKTDTNQGVSPTEVAEVKVGKEEEEEGEVEVEVGQVEPVVGEMKAVPKGAVVEMVHPWPEWIELIDRLVRQNYFDHKRRDEDKLVEDSGFEMPEEVRDDDVQDFTKDWKAVRTACLNFGKDRFDILRSLSRQDIQVLVGYGCPSTDKKVVFSSKLLRKLVHLDEGDVCSSCNLRSTCERGYLTTNKEDEARTMDIMRVLLTYGFDPLNGSVVNDALLKKKSVKTVVRKLLHEVVKLSAVPIDPNLPPPIIKRPPPKVKQAPPPPKKRVGRDDVEMKKGDWLCPKCDFMNFAKNTVCLQCDGKRPKRQLLPGEWECPECNFLNYRRNMACFHCDCKRPPDEFTEVQVEERQRGPRMRPQKVPSRTDVSDAWNLDFDDNESDGADVAAFEYADSRRLEENFSFGKQGNEENMRQPEAGFYKNSRPQRPQEREYSARDTKKAGVGFDDFDDDEEDDIDSYELDSHSGNQAQNSSSIPFSDLDVSSDSDDVEAASGNWSAHRKVSSQRNRNTSKPFHREAVFSGSEGDELDLDSDDELPAHKTWKSSHVANPRQRTGGRRGLNHGSVEDPGPSSGTEDDFPSRRNKGNGWGSAKRRGRSYEVESDLESDNEGGRFSSSDRLRGSKGGHDRSRNPSKGRGGFSFTDEDSRPRSRGLTGDRRNSFKENFDRSSGGSRGDKKGFRGGDRDGHRRNDREDDSHKFKSPRRDNFGNKPGGRFNKSSGYSGADSYLTEERYTRPRDNVR